MPHEHLAQSRAGLEIMCEETKLCGSVLFQSQQGLVTSQRIVGGVVQRIVHSGEMAVN